MSDRFTDMMASRTKRYSLYNTMFYASLYKKQAIEGNIL